MILYSAGKMLTKVENKKGYINETLEDFAF